MHSCRIAALSYILARDVGRLNPERALLAGLLHDIGVTVLINALHDHPALHNDVNGFNQVCRELSGQIGAMVLRAWKFPDVFTIAALEAENFTKAVADRLHLCDGYPCPYPRPAGRPMVTRDRQPLGFSHYEKSTQLRDDRGLPAGRS